MYSMNLFPLFLVDENLVIYKRLIYNQKFGIVINIYKISLMKTFFNYLLI